MTAGIRRYYVRQQRFPIMIHQHCSTNFRNDDFRCVRNWRIAAAENPLGFTVNLRLTSKIETWNRNQ
jgi:hypothetical protein